MTKITTPIEKRFRAQPRVKLNLKNDSCELEIFMLHFTDDVLEHIVSEINRTFEPSILKMNQIMMQKVMK